MANQRPTATVRIGAVKAAIWENRKEGERARYSVTFSKRYRDGEGQWKTTHSFGRNDLLLIAKVADQAHSRIVEMEQSEDSSAQEEEEPPSLGGGGTGPPPFLSRLPFSIIALETLK